MLNSFPHILCACVIEYIHLMIFSCAWIREYTVPRSRNTDSSISSTSPHPLLWRGSGTFSTALDSPALFRCLYSPICHARTNLHRNISSGPNSLMRVQSQVFHPWNATLPKFCLCSHARRDASRLLIIIRTVSEKSPKTRRALLRWYAECQQARGHIYGSCRKAGPQLVTTHN